jgi:type I restriction enzyme S subunit
MSYLDLPDTWLTTHLESVGTVVTGKTPSKKKIEYFNGSIPFIKPGDINDQGKVLFTDDSITELGAETVPTIPSGTIVVTCIGNLGRCAITTKRSSTNQQINAVIPSNGINTDFLYYQLRTLKNWMLKESSATTVTIINKSRFSKAPIALPPVTEQKVIADKLDELLAQVESTKARLDAIPAILKSFRQSVLAAAVSGRLTEEWRVGKKFYIDEEIEKISESRIRLHESDSKFHFDRTGKKLRHYDYSTLNVEPESRVIPECWKQVKLGCILSYLTDYHANGSYEVLKEHVELKETEDYACMIRATNFEKNNFENLFVYISKHAYDFLGKSKLYGNELLIGKIGNAGSVYLMPSLNRPASLAMNLFSLRFDEKLVSPKYLYLFMTSTIGEQNIQKYVRGVATKSIDKKSLRSVLINYPSFEEQTEIVRRVEELFAFADKVEAQVNAAQTRVNNLTQSILAKAFRGELTADWRAANPELISGKNSAEALLKRIKVEREALATKKKPTNKLK